MKEGGYIVVDFGCEFQGGIEITTTSLIRPENENSANPLDAYGKIRVVFGESVTEALSSIGDENNALNDHSIRDITLQTSCMSTIEYGRTGYRFAKIEAVEGIIYLTNVKGVFEYRDLEYKGSFCCNDEKLNAVFDTAAYTVHLNMQEYIWEGIKRDRLVWIGDLHPEVSTICSIFGYDESVEKTLDLARDSYPIEGESGQNSQRSNWMGFPSYSCWWIIIHRDWFYQNGDVEYLMEQKEYMYKLVKALIARVDSDGNLDFGEEYFVDWSSNNTPYMEAGFRSCFILAMQAATEIFKVYGDVNMSLECSLTVEKIKKIVPPYNGNKQVSAITSLSELCDSKHINEILSQNLFQGLSTFYGYYVLLALAKSGNIQGAIDVMRNYWGGMLEHGATTFWEDFDLDWTKSAGRIDEIVPEGKTDIHSAYGKFCYQKLRHSLCHGWASGPAPFISRYILGVKILEPGCKRVRILPNLGDLKWAKGTYPTPYGVIEIEHTSVQGKIHTKVKAVKEIIIEQ